MKKFNNILQNILEEVQPNQKELKNINKKTRDFMKELKEEIKKQKINAVPFIGGSFAKGTLINKEKYDIDIFIRFDKNYSDTEISKLTKNIIGKLRKIQKVHGSRIYYRVYEKDNLIFEIVPVTKVNKPQDAKNTTDLSYFHVRYLKKKLKNEKLKQEIMLAKAFCNANKCYGAESHIRGFSGYSLELLICYYKSFRKFLREITKIKSPEVIDIEKHYKTKKEALMNLNESKIESPIILIDPTFKQRNALAALSDETFEKFQKTAKKFLENPSEDYFKPEKINTEEIKTKAKKSKKDFIVFETNTNKQEGAIAGSKLLKFHKFISEVLKRYFEVYEKGFEYSEGKTALNYFIVKPKKELIFNGPFIEDKKNAEKFLKKHKKVFKKNNRYYAKEKFEKNIKEFIEKFKKENKKFMEDMCITDLKIISY